ncbi:MAG: NAD(P)-binding protein, partial [bacterium]|nr:NAD(P)-binding protein [bacterium]
MGSEPIQQDTCLVVGAGIAGLLAARALQDAGRAVTVLDEGHEVGGRMATRTIGEGVVDHGAQFFTAQSDRFRTLVDEWTAAGVVDVWCEGFASADGRILADSLPRYRCPKGMRSLPEHLAQGLDVRAQTKAAAVSQADGGWTVTTDSGDTLTAAALVMTPPAPQSLELLQAGEVDLPDATRSQLKAIEYDRCIAALVTLGGPSRMAEPGGLRMPCDEVVWVADNGLKGISSGAHTVTVHGSPEFSREYWDKEDDLVTTLLLSAVYEYIGQNIAESELHRWRYAQPAHVHSDPCLVA